MYSKGLLFKLQGHLSKLLDDKTKNYDKMKKTKSYIAMANPQLPYASVNKNELYIQQLSIMY